MNRRWGKARAAKVMLWAGGLLTVVGVIALVGAGYYYDTTGGGPSDALTYVVWGTFLLGLATMVVALVLLALK